MPSRPTLILTGYRATGKSTVARALAEPLGLAFLDLDLVLEERIGMPIRDFVAAQGWPAFRARERALLEELAGQDGYLLATGGGAILHQEIWPRLMENGFVAWLRAAPEIIAARLAADPVSGTQRPSLTGTGIVEEIVAVLSEREPLYRQGSHLAVEAARPLAEVAETIRTAYLACVAAREENASTTNKPGPAPA